MRRRGDWMQTFTGHKFWPHDPRPGDFVLDDIAVPLSRIARFGGHTSKPVNVASHCLAVLTLARQSGDFTPSEQLALLMHDAAEAYIGDMVRPLKASMREFRMTEQRILVALATQFKFGDVLLDGRWYTRLRHLDDTALAWEARDYMGDPEWGLALPTPPRADFPRLKKQRAADAFAREVVSLTTAIETGGAS